MEKRSKLKTADWSLLRRKLVNYEKQQRFLQQAERDERLKTLLHAQGYKIKGKPMVKYNIRVPQTQKQWLLKHAEAPEKIRTFIIELMREERVNVWTDETVRLTVEQRKETEKKLFAKRQIFPIRPNSLNIKIQRFDEKKAKADKQIKPIIKETYTVSSDETPPPPLVKSIKYPPYPPYPPNIVAQKVDSLVDVGETVTQTQCPVCKKPFNENDIVEEKDGVLVHHRCR